jgi:hypothetical protein
MDPIRRRTLRTMVSASVAARIPWAMSQPVEDADRAAFMALSAIIAGRATLDAGLARRLYDALVADDPGFPVAARVLLRLIQHYSIEVSRLQGVPDAQASPLATVPRRVATAWFLGIVGANERARCVAYEEALNAAIVGDILKPPTYCYGTYGSWGGRPL